MPEKGSKNTGTGRVKQRNQTQVLRVSLWMSIRDLRNPVVKKALSNTNLV